MADLSNLTPTQVLALSKALNRNQVTNARGAVSPGNHIVPTFQVEIGGNLEVKEDESYTPTTSVSLIGATCLAIRRMGIQREAFLKAMKEVCQEALQHDEQTRAALMAEANVREFERAFRSEFTSQLPQKTRNGKVFANLEVGTPD